MVLNPTMSGFDLLLSQLADDPAAAAERYEELRLRVIKILHWKGCPETEADDLADVVIDRIGDKLVQGEMVANVNAYAAAVVRFVWLERLRKRKEDAVGDDMPERAVQPDFVWVDDEDERLACLRRCLAEVAPDDRDRRLIIGYYDTESAGSNKSARARLAEALGISAGALKVKACRLRARLEACIADCVRNVTERTRTGTHVREVIQP